METLISGFGLIEGPVFDPARGLIFSDVTGGGVRCLTPTGELEMVVEHRRGIGGMALHAAGGLVVSGRNVAYKGPDGGATVVLLDRDPDRGILGFNDLTTDQAGRVYVGGLAFHATVADEQPKPGDLYVIDLDGTSRRLAGDILLSNGLGFSPDGRYLYHCDSRAGLVRRYRADGQGGIGEATEFARFADGLPDGLAVAADGTIWIAMAHGGAVVRLNPDGSERGRIPVPLPMVTSLCFGGADMRDLYIVTGSAGAAREDAGTVFRTRTEVAGLPIPPARVPIA